MIDCKNNEKISHDKISIHDVKSLEDMSANLRSIAIEQIIVNQTQRMILERLFNHTKIIKSSEWMIHASNFRKFEDFVQECANLNLMIRNNLNDFLLQLKMLDCVTEKIKSNILKSLPTICEIINSDGRNEKKVEINQTEGFDTLKKEDSSEQDKFFRIACEIFPTRTSVGKYDWRTRLWKILKYKLKRFAIRAIRPILKTYKGRSKIAQMKERIRGRFVKSASLKNRKFFFKVKRQILRK